jgi:hypothetical protein
MARSFHMRLFLFENEVENGELHKHRNAHNQYRSYEIVDADNHCQLEENYMKQEIHSVRPREADESLPCGRGAEGEDACHIEVDEETDDISYGIGDVYLDEMLKNEVNDIVNGCRETSVDDEADKLRSALVFSAKVVGLLLYVFYAIHSTIACLLNCYSES